MRQCLYCGKPTNNQEFCSSSCSAKYNNPSRRKPRKCCLFCGEQVKQRHNKFCDNKCSVSYYQEQYLERWKNGLQDGISGDYQLSNHIRRYLIQKSNNKCSQCGWSQINPYTNSIPLQIDHIDGNYQNNKQQNLRVLCPNCHSLTKTYKGANRGRGRTQRKKYYNENIAECQQLVSQPAS